MRAFLFQRWGRSTAAALLAGLIAACGGGAAPEDALAAFTRQALDWQACDSALLDSADAEALARFGRQAQCALLRVPMDYDNPAGAVLQVELLRVAASQPQQRLGAIVFNPGGPGENGLMTAVSGGLALMASEDERLRAMASRYDLVGFSPRGTGTRNPLICDVTSPLKVQDSYVFNRSAENLQALQLNARAMAEACLSHPLTPHLHTDATARDMDLMRAVLGESRLNYIGYSYGTRLGAWYSRLFPERVGRMLLDSNDDIVDSLSWISDVGMGNQRILDQIMLPYAAGHNARLGMGDAATLRNALLALSAQLKEALFESMDFRNSSELDRSVLLMTAALGLETLMQAHPDADNEALQALVQNYPSFAPIPQNNATAALLALKLIDKMKEDEDDDFDTSESAAEVRRSADGRMKVLPGISVLMSVRCNESAKLGDAQYWLDKSHDDVLRHPMFGGFAATNFCVYWNLPERPFPAAPAGVQQPLLMLQSRYDGATQIEDAMSSLAALPQARMIVVEDEYQHGLFPYGTQCVDRQVADYFLQGTLPQRLGSCAGKARNGAAGT